ncbi:MAG: tetratricopeptide repeat protein, partial [candidate division KSB1 bacterium]|nr:tetratricopeptide repeat protein [candidate division KSB1 bacterium]
VLSIQAYGQIRPLAGRDQDEKHVVRGVALFKKGQLELAKKEFEAAIAINKKNVKAHEFLAQVFLNEKDFTRALEVARITLRLEPRSARAHYVAGMVFLEQKKPLAAADEFRKALKLAQTAEEKETAQKVLARFRDERSDQIKRLQEARVTRVDITELSPAATPTAVRQDTAVSPIKPKVAIFAFEDTNVGAESFGEALSEMLTTALIQTNRFEVFERAQLARVLQEQALGQSGALDQETAVEVGKLIGVDAVVVGSISQLGTVMEADARLIEVETSRAVAAANGHVSSADQLRQLANQLARELATLSNFYR